MTETTRALNLAILIGRFPPGATGGAELQAERWAAHLSERHRVTVITRGALGASTRTERRQGYDVLRLPASTIPIWRAVRDLSAIHRTVISLEPRPHLLLCFQTFVSGYAGVRLQRRLGIPAVVWIRGEGEYRMGTSSWTRWVGPRVWGAATGVLVQSEENRRAFLLELERHAPGVRPWVEPRLEVVPNGLDLPEWPGPAARQGGGVLAVGRLIRDKGMDTLIEAMAGLTATLVVAGVGPERRRLEELARARGVTTRFEGFVDRARLSELHREANCLVLAARRGEGLPNAVLEAMAAGCPVVATDVTGIHDLIRDGQNGIVVPAENPPALRAALVRLLGEGELRERLGANARREAESYAWEQVQPRLERLLDRWAR